MASLDEIIAALLRDVEAALERNSTPDPQMRLEAERVILALEVSILEKRGPDGSAQLSFQVLPHGTPSDAGKAHRITFEFRPVRSPLSNGTHSGSHPKPELIQPNAPHLDTKVTEEAMKSLSAVFGPPGFDSSARATVFREVFSELTAPQTEALLASFSAGTIQEDDATLLNARHRLNGVLRSGPLRSVERGGAIIGEMFRCQAPERILVLIAERWKTQGEWT